MNNPNSNFYLPNQPEYNKEFWNYALGMETSEGYLDAGKKRTGGYVLPSVNDERFTKTLKKACSATLEPASYETEQKQLEIRKAELTELITAAKEQRQNVDSFIGMVRKYTDITELTAEIIRSFVEKIEVLKPEKVPGTRTKKQTIVIYWNFIGTIDIPEEQEKTA
ncbi:MAG: DUF4368 domain-containing protein [Pyramidobacter sp.]|uniref:DUF4368 domain-containing protein n=1 Tax=Pyramidobacter sp. TaxID=1943581 RepID=UPI002A8195C1|nr:DUF4368 domain-containing protein [Pyramidobacter sp.]MDY4031607.1 DUF4368 domain-containing protein [Pyramidobacter sp.]